MPNTVTVSEALPEWSDPWRHPRYFEGVTLRRIYAYLLDVVVVMMLGGMALVASMIVGALSFGLLWKPALLLTALIPLAYHTLLVSGPRCATFGMRAAGIRVMSIAIDGAQRGGRPTPFQAMIQTVTFYGSIAATGMVVLLVALFNPRRRTLHDFLAGTVVVNDPSLWDDSTP
jgi:uncharacterized RDD family membrane protein YckC